LRLTRVIAGENRSGAENLLAVQSSFRFQVSSFQKTTAKPFAADERRSMLIFRVDFGSRTTHLLAGVFEPKNRV